MAPVIDVVDLTFPWVGTDPFIMTVHHVDHYPAGNDVQGPAVPLLGRRLGADFSYRDGWSMYHGIRVPGFPQHPHRGFETVTVVRRGYVDHSDSLGATARYGHGDVQWLTAGAGIQHAEMFPLVDTDGPNELELFQIWFDLPPEDKMVAAHFGMLWAEDIPTVVYDGGRVRVEVVAGTLDGYVPPPPPPNSWASRPDSEVAIWVIEIDPGGSWTLPPAPPGVNRVLHVAAGDGVTVAGTAVGAGQAVRLRSEHAATVTNPGGPVELLFQQGRPIGAPVFQMGPFVMNGPDEISQAVDDYRRTGFGGWPWSTREPVHPRGEGRFALHADGRVEHRERIPVR